MITVLFILIDLLVLGCSIYLIATLQVVNCILALILIMAWVDIGIHLVDRGF